MEKTVNAFAIVNLGAGFPGEKEARIWGEGGVAVAPIQVFQCEKWAEFVKDSPEHEEEVANGTTTILPCTITYQLPKEASN